MKPDLDPDALEKAAMALYCDGTHGSYDTGEPILGAHDSKWKLTSDVQRQFCRAQARACVTAYLDHLGLVTLRPLTPEEAKAGIKGDGK